MSEENIEVLLQKAENGDLDSQVRLGLLHHEGNGVRKDNIMAVFWLSKVYLEDELEEDDLKIMCGILCELVTSAKIVTANLLVYDIANSQPWNCLLDEHFLSVSKAMEKRAMGKEPTEEDFKLPPELPTT